MALIRRVRVIRLLHDGGVFLFMLSSLGWTADALCVEDFGLQREAGALSASCCGTHGLSLMLTYVHAERGSSTSVMCLLRATIKPHDSKCR
jgi:hypothetical protein